MRFGDADAMRMALEQRLRNEAAATGVALLRLRKRVAFERFLARLAASPAEWVLKGTFALELRLGLQTRMTKDIDLARDKNEAAVTRDRQPRRRSTYGTSSPSRSAAHLRSNRQLDFARFATRSPASLPAVASSGSHSTSALGICAGAGHNRDRRLAGLRRCSSAAARRHRARAAHRREDTRLQRDLRGRGAPQHPRQGSDRPRPHRPPHLAESRASARSAQHDLRPPRHTALRALLRFALLICGLSSLRG